ncbi:MAG TPA: hypothetical protein VL550_00445 [Rhodocyclaceae bacterium]|jgi:hypothetical protein|nr:hypothetical protein [Rhodocyclaceae bacterium]
MNNDYQAVLAVGKSSCNLQLWLQRKGSAEDISSGLVPFRERRGANAVICIIYGTVLWELRCEHQD